MVNIYTGDKDWTDRLWSNLNFGFHGINILAFCLSTLFEKKQTSYRYRPLAFTFVGLTVGIELSMFFFRKISDNYDISNFVFHHIQKEKIEKKALARIIISCFTKYEKLQIPTSNRYFNYFKETHKLELIKNLSNSINPRFIHLIKYLDKQNIKDSIHLDLPFLTTIKKVDKVICLYRTNVQTPNSTYELRAEIMQKLNLPSHMAFTNTKKEGKARDLRYLVKPGSWCEERYRIQAVIVAEQRLLVESLAPTLNVIKALRGNTCSGKSTFICGEKRVMNVDFIKNKLKRAFVNFVAKNQDLYWESRAVYEAFYNDFCQKNKFISDSRLLLPEYLEDEILRYARMQMAPVEIVDLDVELETSYKRVLARDTYGTEPCPPAIVLREGFRDCRKHRRKIIEMVMSEPLVISYNLYATEKQVPVAAKIRNTFVIYNRELFDLCTKEPLEEEMDSIDAIWKDKVDAHA